MLMDKQIFNSSFNNLSARQLSALPFSRVTRVRDLPSLRVPAPHKAIHRQHGMVFAQQLENKSVSVSYVGSSAEPKLTQTHSVKLKTPRVAVFSSANYVRNFFEAVLQAACPGSSFFEVQARRNLSKCPGELPRWQ